MRPVATSQKSPTVAVVYPILFGEEGHFGGGERYAFGLARALSEQTPTKLVTFGPRRRSRRDGTLDIEVYPRLHLLRGRLNNPANPGFLKALAGVDVIHCVGWHEMPTDLAILFARATGKRVFVSDVGGGADVSLSRLVPMHRLVHRFLLLSRFAEESLPGLAGRITIIYGGVDLDKFSPAPVPRQERVLYAGRIIPLKGIDKLIGSLPDDMAITVLGRPYDLDYFEALKRQSKGRPVTFVTDADDAALVAAYRTSRVAVLPTVRVGPGAADDRPNVFGLTIIEAMACGTPVVCTESGPEAELVDDGVTGFVVPANDWDALGRRIKQLMGDVALAEKMGAAARRKVEEMFNWRSVAERCLAAYAEARRPGQLN
ncbi:MAG: hypothetical protein PVSMB9_10360 [Candidatus Dormibacteria bacterium]